MTAARRQLTDDGEQEREKHRILQMTEEGWELN